ncbi:oligosaccharide flippase family protein [Riemerella columbipharyngis]|uniref:Membrane protein involved in the export of O-antigen and teichoic acid n=1 Tax=Riemerella columbipharyngis TaxID=1071918 RepID=A0A1G6YVJ6_9FLAO|nr:oligosaccharide flippase family protein [Riemerella columbipharyngis]SDD94534.1 Membrane protein involved in the export of O-antigen and teichoic acid [Riemerella columbipharyngis]
MIDIRKNLKSEFSRNVLTLITGTTVAQMIPILVSPILTRIYTPEDFGILALFISVSTILSSMICGRYELAIILPEKEEDAINILALGFILAAFLSFVLFLIVVLFHHTLASALGNLKIEIWLYFIPLVIFTLGVFSLLNYYNNRKKYYEDLAKATVLRSIVLSIVQILGGFFYKGAGGLVIGQIISSFSANLKLVKNISKDKVLISKINKNHILTVANKYKRFPQFSMWSALANNMGFQFYNVLVSAYYSSKTLGFYSMSNRVLGMPATLVGGAMAQVFFQHAAEEKQKTGLTKSIFIKTLKKTLIISLPTFLIIFLIIEDLFALVYGESWRVAGSYVKIVTPMFFIRFNVVTVSNVMNIYGKEKALLIWQIALCLIALLSIFTCSYLKYPFEISLYAMSIGLSLNYLILLYMVYNLSNKGKLF